MEKIGNMMIDSREKISESYKGQILTIPFEQFVFDPMPFMGRMEKAFNSKITSTTLNVLKKQKVPRTKISDGIPLAVYKRCGWVPPKKGLSEKDELELRRKFAQQSASDEALAVLDKLSSEYENKYMKNML
jgi:hypothetical protein